MKKSLSDHHKKVVSNYPFITVFIYSHHFWYNKISAALTETVIILVLIIHISMPAIV